MDIQNSDDKHEKALKEAKKIYVTIGQVWCPVLNEYINFNQVGFEHLLRRGMKWRLKDDQMRRFRLLKYVKNIIGDGESVLIQRDEETVRFNRKFWALTQKIDNRIIVVVIRQTKMGQKHFFSVYDQKTTH